MVEGAHLGACVAVCMTKCSIPGAAGSALRIRRLTMQIGDARCRSTSGRVIALFPMTVFAPRLPNNIKGHG